MTWWSWLLEIAGITLLGASIVFSMRRARKGAAILPVALAITTASALLAFLLFVFLSPVRPGEDLVTAMILLGLAAGAGACLPAKVWGQGRIGISSSQGQWYLVAWSSMMLVSSLLVVMGQGAARAAVALTAFASFGVIAYASVLFLKHAVLSRRAAGTMNA